MRGATFGSVVVIGAGHFRQEPVASIFCASMIQASAGAAFRGAVGSASPARNPVRRPQVDRLRPWPRCPPARSARCACRSATRADPVAPMTKASHARATGRKFDSSGGVGRAGKLATAGGVVARAVHGLAPALTRTVSGGQISRVASSPSCRPTAPGIFPPWAEPARAELAPVCRAGRRGDGVRAPRHGPAGAAQRGGREDPFHRHARGGVFREIVAENRAMPTRACGRKKFQEFKFGAMGTGVAVGDFDGDGKPDVFVVSKTEARAGCFGIWGNWKFGGRDREGRHHGARQAGSVDARGRVCGREQRRPAGSLSVPVRRPEPTVHQPRRRHLQGGGRGARPRGERRQRGWVHSMRLRLRDGCCWMYTCRPTCSMR